MFGLDQTAAVYTPNGTDGDFDVLAKSGLACRLAHVQTTQREMGDERAEIGHLRRLMWGPDYEMPAIAQIEIDGQRWNVQPETVEALRGPDSSVIYRRCTAVIVI